MDTANTKIVGMKMDNRHFGKQKVMKLNLRQWLLILFFILTVICLSLLAIWIVTAKTNGGKMGLSKKSVIITVGKSQKIKVKNLPKGAKVTWECI
ncbi:MAG: hypothetical protein HFG34_08025 [Eubacterium sp.]|nr:hypothetical protein [Eubacterium sp.]